MEISPNKQNQESIILNSKNETEAFKISASAEFFHNLSDTLYQDKALAVAREVMCNAWDAHTFAGIPNEPIKVTLGENTLTIQDFGNGIPKEDFLDIYGTYGASTKIKDSTQTGGFGLGCKSPFALVDVFTVTSICNGIKTIYILNKNSNQEGKPGITEISSMPTEEASGVTVTLNVDDMYQMVSKIRTVMFNSKQTTLFNGELFGSDLSLPVFKEDTLAIVSEQGLPCTNGYALNVRYGNVLYNLPLSINKSDKNKNEIELAMTELIDLIKVKLGLNLTDYYSDRIYDQFFIEASPNSLSVVPSRESLSLSHQTINHIKGIIQNTIDSIIKLEDKLEATFNDTAQRAANKVVSLYGKKSKFNILNSITNPVVSLVDINIRVIKVDTKPCYELNLYTSNAMQDRTETVSVVRALFNSLRTYSSCKNKTNLVPSIPWNVFLVNSFKKYNPDYISLVNSFEKAHTNKELVKWYETNIIGTLETVCPELFTGYKAKVVALPKLVNYSDDGMFDIELMLNTIEKSQIHNYMGIIQMKSIYLIDGGYRMASRAAKHPYSSSDSKYKISVNTYDERPHVSFPDGAIVLSLTMAKASKFNKYIEEFRSYGFKVIDLRGPNFKRTPPPEVLARYTKPSTKAKPSKYVKPKESNKYWYGSIGTTEGYKLFNNYNISGDDPRKTLTEHDDLPDYVVLLRKSSLSSDRDTISFVPNDLVPGHFLYAGVVRSILSSAGKNGGIVCTQSDFDKFIKLGVPDSHTWLKNHINTITSELNTDKEVQAKLAKEFLSYLLDNYVTRCNLGISTSMLNKYLKEYNFEFSKGYFYSSFHSTMFINWMNTVPLFIELFGKDVYNFNNFTSYDDKKNIEVINNFIKVFNEGLNLDINTELIDSIIKMNQLHDYFETIKYDLLDKVLSTKPTLIDSLAAVEICIDTIKGLLNEKS